MLAKQHQKGYCYFPGVGPMWDLRIKLTKLYQLVKAVSL